MVTMQTQLQVRHSTNGKVPLLGGGVKLRYFYCTYFVKSRYPSIIPQPSSSTITSVTGMELYTQYYGRLFVGSQIELRIPKKPDRKVLFHSLIPVI